MPPPLNSIERDGNAIVTVSRTLLDGRTDPAVAVFPAHPIDASEGTDSDLELFELADAASFDGGNNRRIGVVALKHVPDGPVRLGLEVNESLIDGVVELGVAVQGLMEELHESEVRIATSDTNLSRADLRQMGGIGLRQGDFRLELLEAA